MSKKKKVTLAAPLGKSTKPSKSAGKGSNKKTDPGLKNVAENRKAKFRYEILDTVECGLALMGSEVKSLREGKLSLDEAYVRIKNNELWLVGADISHYNHAGMWNHEASRPRKLLLHARELAQFAGAAREGGLTLIPLRVYFNARGLAKCLMGLARGKKLHDKRETIKQRDTERGLQRAMRQRR